MAEHPQNVSEIALDADASFDRLVCSIVAKLEAGEPVDLTAIAAGSAE